MTDDVVEAPACEGCGEAKEYIEPFATAGASGDYYCTNPDCEVG